MNNRERMMQLAEEFFDMRNDPEQISVDEEVMQRLHSIDPASLNELATADGPVAWVLVFPTTGELMREFVSGRISEKELLDCTPQGVPYEAIYLCSALVLPEHRRKGLAKQLTMNAILSIMSRHPVKTLFVWAFSEEGDQLASELAEATRLPLLRRNA